jgi:hypothetical protein
MMKGTGSEIGAGNPQSVDDQLYRREWLAADLAPG